MYGRYIYMALLLFSGLLGGCIKEDMSKCVPDARGLRMKFCYILNTEYKCILEKKVESLYAYIFDQQTRTLVRIVTLSPDDILRKWIDVEDLPAGTYTISAWGASSRDMDHGGYFTAEMTDPAASTFTSPVAIGRTTIEDFRMMLATEPLHATNNPAHDHNHPGEVMPVVGDTFDDLYFASAENVEVVDGARREVDMEMIKNTSLLHIKVTGLEYLLDGNTRAGEEDRLPFVCISGHNERYCYDNTIEASARDVCFEPPTTLLEGNNTMDLDIRVQRLDIVRFKSEPVALHIRYADTGENIIPPIDIINDVIVKVKDKATGRFLWPDQEAVDRYTEFSMEVSILADLDVKVIVNGYEVVDTGANIGRD